MKVGFSFLPYLSHVWIKKCLSVADNARDAVILHVSASSEGQECANDSGPVT
jgi:hypothetical protein